ncbi:MAG: tetratricopeptide repeat protein [Candidatus Hermodarchaeota archaeon]
MGWDWKEGLQSILAARKKHTSPSDRILLLALLAQQIYTLSRMNRLDEALEVITEGDAILDSLTAKERETGAYWVAFFEHRKGTYYFTEDWDTALEHTQRALVLREEVGDFYGTVLTLGSLGELYSIKGDPNTALDYFQQALVIAEQIGNLSLAAYIFTLIGAISNTKDEFNTALEYHQQALSIYEKIDASTGITEALNNIGFIYWSKGELDTALEYSQQMLTVREAIGNPEGIAWALFLNGTVYRHKGELNTSLDYWQRSLAIYEAAGNDIGASFPLTSLILLSLDQQDLVQARKYLTQLQKLHERTPDKTIHHKSRLAEALVLKQSKRMRDKAQAQAILQQLINEKRLFFDAAELGSVHAFNAAAIDLYASDPRIHLCELLLVEVKSFGDPEVWEEVKTLIQQLHVKAQDYHSFSMIVDTLLLQAKVAAIDGDLQQALKYYEQARLTAEEKKLGLLGKKVDAEQKHFEAEFEKWQILIQRNASIQERLNQSQLDDYIQQVQKKVMHMED